VIEPVNLDKLASIVDELPTLPNVMFEVLAVAEDDKSTAEDLEEVIMRDQALSAKVLKVANSAYYGIPRTVDTVSRATILLGFQTVVGLALTVSVYETLWGAGKGHYIDRRELWKHSLGVATAARIISPEPDGKVGAVAFTAGMLHDIGKTVLDSHLGEEYGKVVQECHTSGMTMYDAENALLGVNHADLGQKLARRWQLPEFLTESIHYHHNPGGAEGEFAKAGALVSMSDYLAKRVGIGDSGDSKEPAINQEAIAIWGGSEKQLALAADKLEGFRDRIDAFQT
jgi:putative nucleotidyltransferase with HDIG domain